ncbi:hypothetical protein DWF04_006980 [Cereibacter sphaeroides f. sp. denitrificans]|nr:hypothetical protein DWF04_00895 [Cereibacter sphaeroides f. sp. denitrificans]
MIATDDPLQDRPRAGAQDRADERLAGAVRVMACEAAPLEAADPPAEGAILRLERDPQRPFASGAVLLLDEAGRAVAQLSALPVRMLAALLDNGCESFALVERTGPRVSVGIHLAAPLWG